MATPNPIWVFRNSDSTEKLPRYVSDNSRTNEARIDAAATTSGRNASIDANTNASTASADRTEEDLGENTRTVRVRAGGKHVVAGDSDRAAGRLGRLERCPDLLGRDLRRQ